MPTPNEKITLDTLFEDIQAVVEQYNEENLDAGKKDLTVDVDQIAEDILAKALFSTNDPNDLVRGLINKGVNEENLIRIAVKADWNEIQLGSLLYDLGKKEVLGLIPVIKMLDDQKLLTGERVVLVLETILTDKNIVAVLRSINRSDAEIREALNMAWGDDEEKVTKALAA